MAKNRIQVDFTGLEIQPTLKGAPVKVDLTDVIAEEVYQHARTLAAHKLALKIDEGKGKVDLDEAEIRIVLASIVDLKYYAQMAIKKVLNDEKEL